MNDFGEFDKQMSKICECSHMRGEHDWSESAFYSHGFDSKQTKLEPCNDKDCNCKNFKETHDEKVIDIFTERLAREQRPEVDYYSGELEQDEVEK